MTLKGDSNVGMTIPSKLQGYMAAGKPVLAAINGSAKEIIKDSECGISVEAGDYRALAMAMVKMIDEKEKLVSYGKNGREYFLKNFTKERYINNTVNILDSLVEAHKICLQAKHY